MPAALCDAVAWGTLRREHGSFVDARLADRHCDLLFRARLCAGLRGRIFFLLEHYLRRRDPLAHDALIRLLHRVVVANRAIRGSPRAAAEMSLC